MLTRLDDGIRFRLLKHHHRPLSFPTEYQDGCFRSFLPEYFSDRPWLEYSDNLAGAFCIPCALFVDSKMRKQTASLVNSPFNRYARVNTLEKHAEKDYHKEAVAAAKGFLGSLKHPEKGHVVTALSERSKQIVARNRKVLAHIVTSVLWLGRQGLAYRGHREALGSGEGADVTNKGNFLQLVLLLGNYNEELHEHLEMAKKTTYLSPDIQNQIISIIGNDFIRPKIVQEVKEAKYFSIICDEATSAKTEYMSLVLRFVDKSRDIREEFLGFVPVLRTSGQLLAEKIMETLDHHNIELANCRGQGYDGAAAMSSSRCGVQAVISEENTKALYFHCASHCLNLVISHSCNDVTIRTMISKINEVGAII